MIVSEGVCYYLFLSTIDAVDCRIDEEK